MSDYFDRIERQLVGQIEAGARPERRKPTGRVLAPLVAALKNAAALTPDKYGPAQVQLDFTGMRKGNVAALERLKSRLEASVSA